MVRTLRSRNLIWVMTPFERPEPGLVVAAGRAGATGVLDLGADLGQAQVALAKVNARIHVPFGVRVTTRCPIVPSDLPDLVDIVVVEDASMTDVWRRRQVVAEVRSTDEALAALQGGVDGLIAKGSESGGRVGVIGAFVLLQQIMAMPELRTGFPVWVLGGIGPQTAAAAVAGGAIGVVLDSQMALVKESTLTPAVKAVIRAMDGSETRVVAGHRIFHRPDLWVAGLGPLTAADEISDRLGGDDLRTQALPTGQDAAFAAGLADRFRTAGSVINSLRSTIIDQVASAQADPALAEGSPFASALDIRYPIVQGPMTRVSDQPAFAAAVAEGGALPFLALSLLPGPEVRRLLDETGKRLADRAWGVGILGFVPRELRDEQLAVIGEAGPPVALIAGGRPSQAAPLEAAGITTFLHVPSTGLLDRFLKEGARRFVFEGSECGGHVGPLSSFALWQGQIDRLLDFESLDEVSVLFAGGIHDARSAAMVSALCVPLTERGAKVGVLMGTGYVFTEEAVAAGAITEEFQRQAIDCTHTALLESGPGHASRCAETPYVAVFEQTRRRLVAEGAEAATVWAELEGLNLGRLRLASKGLRRDGDEIVDVTRDEQRRDGMFMIGEVATLHDRVTTIAELHESVTAGARSFLAGVALPERPSRPKPKPVDIAVIGMACVFPGATDLDEFWSNIVNGVNSVTEVPAARWSIERYFDPDYDPATAQRSRENRSSSKWGGFLPDIGFDAFEYGIPPASLPAIEPAQLLSLQVAKRALADAGYGDRVFDRDRTSVVFGAEGGTDQSASYSFRALLPTYLGEVPPQLDEYLPRMTEDSFPGLLTNVIAGRIANRLDLGGKNLTVDAACASSLAALDVGCNELVDGGSDLVLCGGADLHNGVHDFLLFSSVHALSPSGQCRPFDADADGIALGEGVACVVLKRLADAERDGDRVYAVVKSVAGSSDGRSLGLTAPRQQGQERALRRAYARAGLSPAQVGLVEAHGTGTVVGDRTELATLTEIFAEAGSAEHSCVLGSVKSNVGHTKCAAGLAGLIKAAKAVYHGVLPPTVNLERPNRAWDQDTSPFVFADAPRPWLSPSRVAALSAFGFGGTNYHAVIASHDEPEPTVAGLARWPAELFTFRGDDAEVDAAVDALAAKLAAHDGPPEQWSLRDMAAAVNDRHGAPVRVAVVADDVEDLRSKLRSARDRRAGHGVFIATAEAGEGGVPTIAFLFPGQGSQRPGMLGDVLTAFPATRRFLGLGQPYLRSILPEATFTAEGRDRQRSALTDTRVAQPALGIAGLALADVLTSLSIRPDMVAGHSYGELAALAFADTFDPATLVALSEVRANAILDATGDDRGAMVAVSAARAAVVAAVAGIDVVVANDNHPEQIVLAGSTPAIEAAVAALKAAGLATTRLPVACAFHSPLVAGADATFAAHLESVTIGTPSMPVWSNLTASEYPSDPGELRATMAAQLTSGVRFTEEVLAMYEAGARVFIEAGPGRVLTALVDRILAGRPHVAVACDRPGEHGVRSLLLALGQLAVAGVVMDLSPLFDGRANPDRWLKPKPTPRWVVNGQLVRTADGQVVPGGLRPATEAPRLELRATGAPVGVADPSGETVWQTPASAEGLGAQDRVVFEYLRSVNELIGAGRDIMLGYLGAPLERTAPIRDPDLPPPPSLAITSSVAVPAPDDDDDDDDPAGAAAVGLRSADQLLAVLVQLVSAQTGYPAEMLDPDLDVEADLSIDSIKRIEILGELADRIGLRGSGSFDQLEDLVEELAARKTLRSIVDFLVSRAEADVLRGAAPSSDATTPPSPAGSALGIPERSHCFEVTLASIEAPVRHPTETQPLDRRVAVTGSGPVATALVNELHGRGVAVAASVSGADVVVITDLLQDQPATVTELYPLLRHLLMDGSAAIVVASGLGGGLGVDPPAPLPDGDVIPAGAGIRGLVKTAALEYPDRSVRLVDFDPAAPSAGIAGSIIDELLDPDAPIETAWRGDRRRTSVLSETPPSSAETRTGPLPASVIDLDPEAVVLLTGGARGITALAAVAFAQRSSCRIEIVGRSPIPDDDDDLEMAGARDRVALRKELIDRGWREPSAIERECDRIVVAREMRGTVRALEAAGSKMTYHRADVRDATALRDVVEDIYRRHGRLDGVVHGAGILDDQLIADKSPAAFEEVYSTKVDAARSLIGALRPGVRFVAFFASIAGVLGNRGQADYAAANDALDVIAAANTTVADRIVSLDWGPWAPAAGMVSASRASLFEQAGMGLIQSEDGTERLLHALDGDHRGRSQVVVVRCLPSVLAPGGGKGGESSRPSPEERSDAC